MDATHTIRTAVQTLGRITAVATDGTWNLAPVPAGERHKVVSTAPHRSIRLIAAFASPVDAQLCSILNPTILDEVRALIVAVACAHPAADDIRRSITFRIIGPHNPNHAAELLTTLANAATPGQRHIAHDSTITIDGHTAGVLPLQQNIELVTLATPIVARALAATLTPRSVSTRAALQLASTVTQHTRTPGSPTL